MSDYLHAEDGKIHTRYSELVRCTAGQIDKVIAERQGQARFESEDMAWGSDRHEIWAEESKTTGVLPACFYRLNHEYSIEYLEREFATEILPGVICHSRPDAVSKSAGVLIDYKTMIADHYQQGFDRAWTTYGDCKQLLFYAYQIGLHEIRIKRLVYFVEIWSRDRTSILGYVVIEKNINMGHIGKQLPWVKERIAMLTSNVKAHQ